MIDGTALLAALPAAVLAATVAVAILMRWPDRRAVTAAATGEPGLPPPRSFRFRDGYLVASSPGSDFLLPEPVNQLAAWDDLRGALSEMVPGTDAAMERLSAAGEGFRLSAGLGADVVQVIGLRDGEETLVTVAVAPSRATDMRIDRATLDAQAAETALLRQSGNASPSLSWVVDRDGRVIWGNARYLAEVAQARGAEAAAGWPLPALFPLGEAAPAGPARRPLGGRGRPERWFEVMFAPATGGLRHGHAQPLNRLIEAESNLRTFIQTLTRTFSALPTGLAIFDHDRKMVMYNPQFLDRTGLDGAWLTTKPSLFAVLDALREGQRLPEPRDWTAWREAVASGGCDDTPWQETWTLAGGQSMRMTAQPQGGGAVAILLEDVTAEIALARRRRSDGALMGAMLDAASDAFAAFAPDGTAAHLDATMRRLLDRRVPAGAARGADAPAPTLDDVTARLAALYRPASVWAEARERIARGDVDRAWSASVALGGGRSVGVHVARLSDDRIALRLSGDLDAPCTLAAVPTEAEVAALR